MPSSYSPSTLQDAPSHEEPIRLGRVRPKRNWIHYGVGVSAYVGIGGVGCEIAVPLTSKIALRAGAGFLRVSPSFVDQGAQVNLHIQGGYGKLLADWFPFRGRFHVSPLLVFANQTRVYGDTLIPAGSDIDFQGHTYISSPTDPLRGSARVDMARTAPGVTVGWGSLTHGRGHSLTYSSEFGFFHVRQPALQVNFTGSACDPKQPAAIACDPVLNDPGFQRDLAAFIARNNRNLRYAHFIPVVNVGVGYRF